MTEGQIVTFYSFKGGTGRTMALANVAWILAANGKRVLVADWDLESPGLHRFFNPFLDPAALADTGGVIDLIRQFEWETTRKSRLPEGWHLELARVQQFAFSLNWDFPGGGTLDFLTAGRQNDNYAVTLGGMDWDAFYSRLGGGRFIEALRDDMKRNYDYVLIDSRTGLSDVADICTVHLPDALVDCFTLSEQGLDGAANVARLIQRRHGTRNIRILPVPMRVDPAEKLKADAGRALAVQRFAGLPAELSEEERARYWAAVEVPYRPFYAYEETLATFGDRPGSPTSLLSAYETLTRHITFGEVTELPPMEEALRLRGAARFARRLALPEEEITLRFAAEDQVWAEWIEQVLIEAGVRVNVAPAEELPVDGARPSSDRQLLIVSQASVGMFTDGQNVLPPLVVYVADLRALPAYPIATSAFIAGLSESAATEKILKLVGHPDPAELAVSGRYGVRYPGTDPVVFNIPARNARFTGREDDLQNLRAHLRAQGRAVVVPSTLPVALQGMGGIGKTQVAMEYAHRFKSAYDIVWWIVADPPTFVDSALTDLGTRLGIQPQSSVPDTVRVILQSLARGEPYPRWLLIYDNAEDLEEISPFIPQGTGHVLLTSRNSAWGDRAQSVHLDVFERRESISHLRQRVAISHEEANEVAEVLGDLPIAVAAAGAWLADTGTPVDEYLRQIESHGPSALSVEATWDLSLERLQSRSRAAYRLLQLCSVLAPETALDLIHGDAMASVLAELDPSVSERMVRGALVQQINRLALLKVDLQRKQIQVHRLLQHVVRARMDEEERDEARHRAHLILAASRPGEVDDPSTWPRFRMLWPHLEATEAVECADEAVRQLFIDRVRFIWLRGGLEQGEELARWIEASWQRREETLTGVARTTLRRQLLHLRFQLANILRDQARFEESRQLDEAILDEQRELLGTAHPHTLMTSGGLAADLRALGRYAEALRRDELTYAAWLEHFGEDHPRTLIALNNLASSYRLAGDYHEARTRDEMVYERALLVQGENHPDTLRSLLNLSRDLRETGDYERSIRLLENVHQAYSDLLGPDSIRAAIARANLAISLRAAGRPDPAAPLLDNAYDLLTELLGPASPETLACRLSRAVNLLARGNHEEARHELEVVQVRYEDSLGRAHPHTLASLNNLAVIALGAGEYPLARKRATAAAEDFARTLGTDHPYTMAALINLGISLARDGDPEAALEPMGRAAERLPYILGPAHPYTLRCQANLALLRRQLGGSGPEADVAGILVALGNSIGHDHSVVQTVRDGNYAPRILELHPF